VGRTNDFNYCLFHRMVHHPTSKFYLFKDKVQAIENARALTLKSEQKKVTANMANLNFGTFPKMMFQDRVTPIPKARLNVINPIAEVQKAKGLIPITIKSKEIVWVHPDIVNDEQWEFSQPKLKGKSCNIVSLVTDDDTMTIASLSDLEEEKLALGTARYLVTSKHPVWKAVPVTVQPEP